MCEFLGCFVAFGVLYVWDVCRYWDCPRIFYNLSANTLQVSRI